MLKSFFPNLLHFKKVSPIGANLMSIIANTSAFGQVGGVVALYFLVDFVHFVGK